jgi:hypothetical protein
MNIKSSKNRPIFNTNKTFSHVFVGATPCGCPNALLCVKIDKIPGNLCPLYPEVYPEFIPESCSPDSQQGNSILLDLEFTLGVSLFALLPGVGGEISTKIDSIFAQIWNFLKNFFIPLYIST